VNGGADVLIAGDADLLALNPYEGIPILSAANYLAKTGG
jgi:predicted nucleic acid-binding protein